MRTLALSLLTLTFAACQGQPARENPAGGGEAVAAKSPGPDADINASLEPVASSPSHDVGRLRFIGRWATEERECGRMEWRFTERELRTPEGTTCLFTGVREVPGGFDIAARCAAEANGRDGLIELRFPESAGGMLIESQIISDAGILPCPE